MSDAQIKADLQLDDICKKCLNLFLNCWVQKAFTSFKATVAFSASILTLQEKKYFN